MSRMADRNLLTIGAVLVIIVVSVLLYWPAKLLTQSYMVFATMLGLFGVWLIVLAVLQRSNPEKYGRGAFSYFGWGLMLVAFSSAWFLAYVNIVYSLAVVLLVLAALAIAAAFRRK